MRHKQDTVTEWCDHLVACPLCGTPRRVPLVRSRGRYSPLGLRLLTSLLILWALNTTITSHAMTHQPRDFANSSVPHPSASNHKLTFAIKPSIYELDILLPNQFPDDIASKPSNSSSREFTNKTDRTVPPSQVSGISHHSNVPNTSQTLGSLKRYEPLIFYLPSLNTGPSSKHNLSSAIDNRLFRTGRETHDAFIRRLMSAVSGDNRYVNRHVPHGSVIVRPRRPTIVAEGDSSDLGLPAEMANEYIDGVNPPRFQGVRVFTSTDHNDWRYKSRRKNGASHVKRPNVLPPRVPTTLVLPPPVAANQTKQAYHVTVGVGNKAKAQLSHTPPTHKPLQVKPATAVLPNLNSTSNFDMKNESYLSFLIKQEFDAKNAELNLTQPTSSFDILQNEMFSQSNFHKKPSHMSTVYSEASQEELDRIIKNITHKKPLLGPPYQYPFVPLVKSEMTTVLSVKPSPSSTTELPKLNITTTTTTTTTTERSPITTNKPVQSNRTPSATKVSGSENVFYRVKYPMLPNITRVVKKRPLTIRKTTPVTTISSNLPEVTESVAQNHTKVFPETSLTTPDFVTSISNDVRYQVEQNLTNDINELDLNSDESRVTNTSLGLDSFFRNGNTTIRSSRPNSGYRLTTERLAYILIGSCCALSVLCLVVVAMSVRFKDMCDEYRTWKSAEQAALRWQLEHRLRMMPTRDYLLPRYLASHKNRFNLPRYFRTSIGNTRKINRPMVRGAMNKTERMLDTILSATKLPDANNASMSSCCHCMNCSSTWVFRNPKHGDWCCQRGYYQPPRRTKLPFGAGSSVNTFMPQLSKPMVHHGDEDMDVFHRIDDVLDSNETHWSRMAKLSASAECRAREKGHSKMNKNHRYFADSAGPNVGENGPRCHLAMRRHNSRFCELDSDEHGDDPEEVIDEIATDFEAKFEPHRNGQKGYQSSDTKCKSQNIAACNGEPSRKTNHAMGSESGPSDQCKYYFNSDSTFAKSYRNRENSNGESFSIWVNSSKLVDKLHRKHVHQPPNNVRKVKRDKSRPAPARPDKTEQQPPPRTHHKTPDLFAQQTTSIASLAARLGYPSKSSCDTDCNFVVWNNDTNERLI